MNMREEIKVLVFDMDGTIADLYGVNGWLEDLRNFNPRPYEVARPLYDMETLVTILEVLRLQGWKIIVTSWLSKESTSKYDAMVRKAKKEWLEKNLNESIFMHKKYNALAFNYGPNTPNYYIIDESLMKCLVELLKDID